jgi:hypothetical protein
LGRSPVHAGGGVVAFGARQTLPSNVMPAGQQLGGVPTGRSRGHVPVPVGVGGGVGVEMMRRGAHVRPFQRRPGGQAQTPDDVRTMPLKQLMVDREWNAFPHCGGF